MPVGVIMVHRAVTEPGLAGDVANIKAAAREKVGARGGVQDLPLRCMRMSSFCSLVRGTWVREPPFIDLQICLYKYSNAWGGDMQIICWRKKIKLIN